MLKKNLILNEVIVSRIKNIVWLICKLSSVDVLIARITPLGYFLRKAIPRHTFYKPERYDFSVNKDLKIQINRSDYTQWRVFAGSLTIPPYLVEILPKKSLNILDIGSNIGAFSFLLIAQIRPSHSSIHLFEPNPNLIPTLKENMKRIQNWQSNLTYSISEKGLGDSVGELRFNIKPNFSGSSSIVEKTDNSIEIVIDVTTLDDYAKSVKLDKVDFIKIDVESFEPAVFKGGMKIIRRDKPVLYFECSRNWYVHFSEDYIKEIFDTLIDLGYSFYLETEGIPTKIFYPEFSSLKFANIFATT